MPAFQSGERVRVREGGGPGSLAKQRWLGKEGTITYGLSSSLERGPPAFYFVQFDGGEVESFSTDWLEPIHP